MLRKLAAMRSYMRDVTLGRDGDPSIPAAVGIDEETLYEMYRLMAIAKYDERYVIPTAHVEQAHELEEIGCSLDFDEGPGMYESGPFGEASGRPAPVAVETFNALRQRQTSELDATRRGELRGRVNLLNWDGRGAPPGLFPDEARRPGRVVIGGCGRRAPPPDRDDRVVHLVAATVPRLPAEDARHGAARDAEALAEHGDSPGADCAGLLDHLGGADARDGPPAHLRRHVRPQPQARALPVLLDRRGHPPTRRGAGTVQDGIPQQWTPSSTPTGELPDYLPMVLEFAARVDAEAGRAILQDYRASLELLRIALQEKQSPYAGAVVAVCATLPGESPPIARRSWRWSG